MAKRAKMGIGLDVGSRSVQLAIVRAKRDGFSIEKLASKELPHDSMVEGQILDAEQVTEKLTELIKEHHLKGKDLAIAIGGRRVMIKKVTTDEMSDDELKGTIEYEAKSNLPFDLEDVSLDYARLPQEVDTGRMDVLLVAAKNEVVSNAVETLHAAGGHASLIEAEPFALQAALAESGYLDEHSTVAALQIGFQTTDVTLFQRGQFESNRSLNVGGKTYIEGLIRDLGITFEKAAAILAKSQRSAEEEEALTAVAKKMSDKLADQIERSFPESIGINADVPVNRIVLCGGGAHLPMLIEALHKKFNVDVDIANPLRNITYEGKGDVNEIAELAPDYVAAIGLALRAFGEPHSGFNLLPHTERPEFKKASYAGAGTVITVVSASVLLFGMFVVYLSQQQKITNAKNKLAAIRKETSIYQDKIALVEELTNKRNDVSSRIDVISDLDRNRFARVKYMQLINNSVPELTWITGTDEVVTPHGPGVNISGVTSSNLKVSQFMTNLLQDKTVNGVDLLVSEQMEIANTSVARFTLQAIMPDLNLPTVNADAKPDMIKQGEQAVKAKRQAENSLQKEAAK
jgi:type IV pilus assembly protein PilM